MSAESSLGSMLLITDSKLPATVVSTHGLTEGASHAALMSLTKPVVDRNRSLILGC